MHASVSNCTQQMRENDAICALQKSSPRSRAASRALKTMLRSNGQSTAQRRKSMTARFTRSALLDVWRDFWWYTAHATNKLARIPTCKVTSKTRQLAATNATSMVSCHVLFTCPQTTVELLLISSQITANSMSFYITYRFL